MKFKKGDRVRWIGKSAFGATGTVQKESDGKLVTVLWDDYPDPAEEYTRSVEVI